MTPFNRYRTKLTALRELGPRSLALYATYRLGLRAGLLRRQTAAPPEDGPSWYAPVTLFPHPSKGDLARLLGEEGVQQVCQEAEEIIAGQARLFGGPPVPLVLAPEGQLAHWTEYELGTEGTQERDIKRTWEPARFGWAYTLARAYQLSGDERCPAAFWAYAEQFLEANPPYLGPNWVSAQEAALRLVAFAFCLQVFAPSPETTPERGLHLQQSITAHAARIPPSLAYARSQNNNHLLTEAAGLYTAALALPNHAQAKRWQALGLQWFKRGLLSQIAEDGTYVQHSTNYHRLMLQISLWMDALTRRQGQALSLPVQGRMAVATRWLLALLDPAEGRVPNLGPNDGAYIFPFSICPFNDYRPVLAAAASAFLDKRPFPPGPWDEMGLWFGVAAQGIGEKGKVISSPIPSPLSPASPHVIRTPQSWAYLRAARFTSRPGHADQLHLDLWWRGINVAQDAGTYLYNAPSPWDNALVHTAVHNTITVDGQDQMTPAGRFLFLDWAQGQVLSQGRSGGTAWERLVAQHDGYRRLGIYHRRAVEQQGGRWLVTDTLLPADRATESAYSNLQPVVGRLRPVSCNLHWLLPDWRWEVQEDPAGMGCLLRLQSPYGWVDLRLSFPAAALPPRLLLFRAGKLLYGKGEATPVDGWISPTYGSKEPALSASLLVSGTLPVTLTSEWQFPEDAR